MLGKALGSRRGEIILATKFGAKTGGRGGAADKGGSREYILQACEQSLQRLGTDYIDLYQHHFPDAGTPVEETLRALEELVTQGKVRYVGCSNYSGEQLKAGAIAAKANGTHSFVSAQNRYSLLHRDIEKGLVPIAQGQQVGIIPYFPLESGLLSGKYRQGEKPPADTRFGKWGGGGVFVSGAALGDRREAAGLRRQDRPVAARSRHRLACGTTLRLERHRRRHEAGPDPAERQGGKLGTNARAADSDRGPGSRFGMMPATQFIARDSCAGRRRCRASPY